MLNVALEGVVLKLTLFLGKLLILLMVAQLPLGHGVHLVWILLRALMRNARPVAVLPSLCALRELQVLLPGWAELVAAQVLLLGCQSSLPGNIFGTGDRTIVLSPERAQVEAPAHTWEHRTLKLLRGLSIHRPRSALRCLRLSI